MYGCMMSRSAALSSFRPGTNRSSTSRYLVVWRSPYSSGLETKISCDVTVVFFPDADDGNRCEFEGPSTSF